MTIEKTSFPDSHFRLPWKRARRTNCSILSTLATYSVLSEGIRFCQTIGSTGITVGIALIDENYLESPSSHTCKPSCISYTQMKGFACLGSGRCLDRQLPPLKADETCDRFLTLELPKAGSAPLLSGQGVSSSCSC